MSTINTTLLKQQLSDAQELHAFWTLQEQQTGNRYKYTLQGLQERITELQAQLRQLEG
jgi:hypothetical protein